MIDELHVMIAVTMAMLVAALAWPCRLLADLLGVQL